MSTTKHIELHRDQLFEYRWEPRTTVDKAGVVISISKSLPLPPQGSLPEPCKNNGPAITPEQLAWEADIRQIFKRDAALLVDALKMLPCGTIRELILALAGGSLGDSFSSELVIEAKRAAVLKFAASFVYAENLGDVKDTISHALRKHGFNVRDSSADATDGLFDADGNLSESWFRRQRAEL